MGEDGARMRVGVIRDIVLAADGEVHDCVIVRRGMEVGQLDYCCGVDSGWGKEDSWPGVVARGFICARSGATCGSNFIAVCCLRRPLSYGGTVARVADALSLSSGK